MDLRSISYKFSLVGVLLPCCAMLLTHRLLTLQVIVYVYALVQQFGSESISHARETHLCGVLRNSFILKDEVARLDSTLKPAYVRNNASRIWHKVLAGGHTMPQTLWKAQCGWSFGCGPCTLCGNVLDSLCVRCFETPKASIHASSSFSSSDFS